MMNTDSSRNRRYTSSDMAKIYCEKCKGCGDCCHGMTDTIHLDPYDIYLLCSGLQTTFQQLLDSGRIALHVEDGLTLPHLKMPDSPGSACTFLSSDGRCEIHPFRPGLCRLFPLGRDYDAQTKTFQYFIVDNGCPMPGKMKVKIDKWIGIKDLATYEKFVADWHYFVLDVKAKLTASDESFARALNLFILKVFYLTPYEPSREFYELFYMRLKEARTVL